MTLSPPTPARLDSYLRGKREKRSATRRAREAESLYKQAQLRQRRKQKHVRLMNAKYRRDKVKSLEARQRRQQRIEPRTRFRKREVYLRNDRWKRNKGVSEYPPKTEIRYRFCFSLTFSRLFTAMVWRARCDRSVGNAPIHRTELRAASVYIYVRLAWADHRNKRG